MKNSLGKRVGLCLVFILTLTAVRTAYAGVAFTPLGELKLKENVLDVTVSDDGALFFFLTPGKILVCDAESRRVIDRFAVDPAYDRLSYWAKKNALVLTSGQGTAPGIYQVDVVQRIVLDRLPFRGVADAPVTLAVFSDYQCPYCARLEKLIQHVMKKYPGRIKFVMKHFPLSSHKFARQAARAALAADRQGKYWEFHEQLFANHKNLNDEKIGSIAAKLGLDVKKWQTDMASGEIEALIDRDLANGRKVGVRGTPALFVNGKAAKMGDAATFYNQIESEIKKATGNRAP
jgi:protein-disulfide isomerase